MVCSACLPKKFHSSPRNILVLDHRKIKNRGIPCITTKLFVFNVVALLKSFLQSLISGISISCATVYIFLTYFLRIFPLTSYIQIFVCLFVDCVLDYFKLNEIHCFHFINPTLDSQDKPYLDITLATFFVLPYLCTIISWSLSHLMQ